MITIENTQDFEKLKEKIKRLDVTIHAVGKGAIATHFRLGKTPVGADPFVESNISFPESGGHVYVSTSYSEANDTIQCITIGPGMKRVRTWTLLGEDIHKTETTSLS